MDDLKISHKSLAVVTGIIKWLRGIYGELCILRGKKYKYLGMDLDYSIPGKVVFSMEKYTRNVIADFPVDMGKTTKIPGAEYLFPMQDADSRQTLPKEKIIIPRYQPFFNLAAQ